MERFPSQEHCQHRITGRPGPTLRSPGKRWGQPLEKQEVISQEHRRAVSKNSKGMRKQNGRTRDEDTKSRSWKGKHS